MWFPYNLFFTHFRVDQFVYYNGSSEWYIRGKLFGMIWVKVLKRFTFLSPYGSAVEYGYSSVDSAMKKIGLAVGPESFNKLIEKERLHVVYDKFKTPWKNTGYCVTVNRDTGRYFVAKGYYIQQECWDELYVMEHATKDCNTPSEAILKAELLGIRVDNAMRYRTKTK